MSAAVTCQATKDGVTAKDHAALIAEHFRLYNEEFGRITRRAALNFLAEDWHAAQLDAVARIELYELRVAQVRRGDRQPAAYRSAPTWRSGSISSAPTRSWSRAGPTAISTARSSIR